MMGLAGAIQQLNIATTRLKHDPSIGGSHYALQIASLLAQTHNNMIMMTDDDDDIHATEHATTTTNEDDAQNLRKMMFCGEQDRYVLLQR